MRKGGGKRKGNKEGHRRWHKEGGKLEKVRKGKRMKWKKRK